MKQTKKRLDANDLISRIKALENPYPKDVFKWNNKKTFVQTRGRFNEFIYDVVENTKEKIIKIIQEELQVVEKK